MKKKVFIGLAVVSVSAAYFGVASYSATEASKQAFAEGCKFGTLATLSHLGIQVPRDFLLHNFINCDRNVEEYLKSDRHRFADQQKEMQEEE